MAFKYREEIVGKRFLSVRSATKLKTSKLSDWDWRSGVIRAVTHKDTSNAEFTVLVEFDDCEWKRREWIRVHEIFQVFLVEFTLVWAPRPHPRDGSGPAATVLWPALSYQVVVDKSGFAALKLRATEFVADRELKFLPDSELRFYKVGKFEADDRSVESPARDDPAVRSAVRRWLELQDGQSILLTTPSVLVGYRVEVYCAEGTRQWYTAVIHSYNENTRELSVTDDTVLEVHNEDPSMVQMKLIGDGVVESILKGENLGITPRRRSCNIRKVQPDAESTSSASSSSSVQARVPRTRSQSPSQSSPLSAPAPASRTTPTRAKAARTRTAATTTTPATTTTGSNHSPAANTPAGTGTAAAAAAAPTSANPPDTAPIKDEKEKPPDRGKTRTSQRERKRRTDDVTSVPPAKLKASEKDKDDKEKKVCKEPTLTRTTSVKAGSVLPASTQPTVVVKPVRTPADTKIIRDKDSPREAARSPKTTAATSRARKAKEVPKEPSRTGSPASGVRSRTPQRKEKEAKEKPSIEKPPVEPRRRTRDSSAKRKETKRESKRLKEDDSESSKEGTLSKPPSPASSTSSVCSSIVSLRDCRSRTSTPTRLAETKASRASPAPSGKGSSSDLGKKKDNSSSRAATPNLSDRVGPGGGSGPSAPQSSPAVEESAAAPTAAPSSSSGSCSASSSSSSKEGSNNHSSSRKPTANTTTTTTTTSSCSSSSATVTSDISASSTSSRTSSSTTTTSSSHPVTASSSLSSSTPRSPCSTTGVTTTTTTTTTTTALSCTTSTTSSSASSTSTATTTTTTTPTASRTSPNASPHPASSDSPTDSGLSTSRAPQPARPPGLGTGVGGRTSPPSKDSPDTGSSSSSSNNNKGSSSDIVVVRGGGKDRNGSSSAPVQPSPAATANTSTTNNTTSTSSRLLSSSPTVASLVGKSRTTEQQQKPQQTSHTSSNTTTTSSSVSPPTSSPSVRPASMSHSSKPHSSSSSSSCSKLLSSSGRTSSSNPASSSCSPSSSLLSSSAKSSSRPDDEPAMHYKKMILLEGFKKEPCTSSPPSATAAASQETFTAASGINVNHSLTDQIAKLSSLSKPWNNNDFSSPPPDGGAPPPGPHHPGYLAGGERGEGGREYHHHHHHQGGRPLVGHPLTSPTSSSSTKDRHSRPPSREAETRQLSRTSSSGSLGSHSRVDMALMGRDGDPRDRDRDRDRGSLSRSDVERHDAEVRERLAFHADEQQRSLSRSSAEERRPSSSSSASNSRVEDLRRSVGSTSSGGGGGEPAAHGASPLIFDKNEPVRVYRDPELMKRDEMRYFQQRQQQQQERSASRGGPNTPGGGAFAAVPPGHPAATGLGSPHGAALPQAPGGQRGPMLTHSLPYSPHLNSLQGLSPAHLSSLSPHHGLDPAALRVLSALPPQAMHPYPLLPQYALHSTTQLEILWQQKYPTLPVPPAWMLVQYQEELLRDVNLMSLERERRDREHALERERERVEQAERERAAERDRAEREQRERQRQERERLEREQREREIRERKHREEVAEREKAERLERERLEKERKEQERIKREQRERVGDRGHTLLKETAQAQAAVDQHFTESLRLASQKHAAGAVPWPTGAPSITHGLPKHPAPMAVPPEALSLTAHHQSAFTHRGIPPPHQVAPREHLPSKKDDKLSEGRPDQPSPHHHEAALRSQQEALRHSEEKRHQTLQQEHLLRHQIMMKEKAAGLPPDHHPHSAAKYPPPHHPPQPPHHPADIKKQYPMYVYHPKSVAPSSASQSVTSSATSAGMVMSASHTAVTSIKQEPNFSLYGYQPFQHSYITKETLYSQGLKQDDGGSSKGAGGVPPHPHHPHLLHLKEEPKGSLPPPSHPQAASMHPQQRTASPHGHKHGRVSPPPLIKDSKTGSVIVENRPKEAGDLRHQQQPSEAHRLAASHHSLPPPPAHSHHSGSITLGTALSPRQQQAKGPDGRPQAGGAAYGGHQSRPGSSPHPGHMAPHIHGLPTGSHHPGMVPPPGGRDHHSRSPLSAAQHQQGGMQPMDLHKHMPSSASTSMSTAVKEAPPRPTVVGSHPHHHGHGQAYPAAIAQPPVSLPTPNSTAAHSYNLIQQGLVPNPIYSHAGSSGQQPGPQGQQAVAPPHPQHPQHPSPHQHSPSSMAGQKRRGAPTKDTVEGSQSALPTHHKKSRMAEAMAASANPHAPHPAAGSNSSHSGSPAGHQPGAGLPPTSSSSSSPLARTTAPASQSTSSGFMDSFRSFVENTVQSAFYQDQELAAAKALQQRSNRPKAGAGPSSSNQAVHVLSTQASPMPSTVSVSSPQVASRLQATTTSLAGVPPSNHSSPFTSTTPPLSTQTQAHVANSSAASSLPTHQHTPLPSSSALAISSLPQQHSIGGIPMQRPGPASTPGGASVSSTSSIVDTINRVANGYVESDSDTLSAPSPPPQRSDITPSPSCRPGNHKAFKKAWLQRYSDEDKEKENTTKEAAPSGAGVTGSTTTTTPGTPPQPQENAEGKPGEPVKDCYVNCSYISPTKEGGSKSPISLLSKDLRKDEEDSTTSASETESQTSDGTAKRRLKAAARRRSSGSSGSKKPKLSDDDNSKPTGTTTNTTTTTTTTSPATTTTQTSTGGKKRFSRKGREGVKDSTNKGLSDDEAVKERMDNEEKSRQVLHNQHHKQHQTSTSPSARLVKAETKAEKTNNKNTDKTNDKTETTNSVTTNSKGKKGETSDSESTSTPKENNKKRGRKPRDKKDKDRDSTPPRTENLSTILANKPLNKTNMGKLKKTLEPFIQDSACPEIAPKLMKCRECKMSTNQRNKKIPNIFCRFYAFRRLRYNQKAVLAIAGFSEPSDADMDDIELWMPRLPVANPQLDVGKAKYVIQHVGDQFCQLVEQEKEAMSWVSPDTKVAWKRAVQGVREMCDVCDTTLFNMHWACHKCGFVVCIDCYRQRTRKTGGCMDNKCKTCDNDGQKWLTCSVNRQSHEPDKLMITQIIPSDALWVVGRMIHEVRDKWKIRANCPCGRSKDLLLSPKNGVSQLLSAAIKDSPDRDQDHRGPVLNGNSPTNGDDHKLYKNQTTSVNGNSPPGSLSPLSLLANVASMDSENSRDKKILSKMKEAFELSGGHYNPLEDVARGDDDEKSPANCSTLRELLTKTAGRMKPNPENNKKAKTTLDDIIQQVVERNLPKDSDVAMTPLLKHYIPKNGSTLLSGRDSPIRCYTLTETSVLYPDVPHSWLDNGRLLRLHDPRHKGNLKLFQQQWRRAQPVLVSNCHKRMTRNLWMPDTFAREFGDIENELVNCRTGISLVGHTMREFWEGFECAKKRLKDEKGRKMILKLKDWPPTEDFSEVLPGRFQDLMNGLPLPEYTHRNGIYNMASRLPDFFVKPDLGPKMYNAYGSALYPREGTTNLHLDVSDAVNTMVCVAIPRDDDVDHATAALKAIDEAGCDILTKQRIKETEEFPGALWHIFDPLDADKIRDLLNKIAKERGEKIEPHHDPIHDQSWYLDENIRKRLLEEYSVQGYTILQCLGDAVFIPAGAPHQVRNLHSCIKAAEDFVSPENVSYCFKMTQEFRHLSDTHSNHEDKLQVKNIIYHTVKDAVAVLREASP